MYVCMYLKRLMSQPPERLVLVLIPKNHDKLCQTNKPSTFKKLDPEVVFGKVKKDRLIPYVC